MSLFSSYGLSVSTVRLLTQASHEAFSSAPALSGWSDTTFNNRLTGASATVFRSQSQPNTYILAFRGTDDAQDVAVYPLLTTGQYLNLFDPLLKSLPSGANYYVTGASLGGGAVNLLAEVADTAYGGKFANAKFVALASPNISNANGIVNIGFENDPIYKVLDAYENEPSSLDNLVLATHDYMTGNYDGRHPYDDYAHSMEKWLEALHGLEQSAYQDRMRPDSVVVFAATGETIKDITPGRASTGAFYIGRATADTMVGREENDFLEGFGAADTLWGKGGRDNLQGGTGNDRLNGGSGNDTLTGGPDRDAFIFDTTPKATQNVDSIKDFVAADDTIRLENSIFKGLSKTGTLTPSAFHLGTAAADLSDRVIYDRSTGSLYYDADGIGVAAQVKFAVLLNKPLISYQDFFAI
jgi:Ca2+-binding RTX toxin-like protein